ncbi:uncharacterized protein LOC106066468 [Biomphalaria glabrata]|uniref:Uncharacterized protein LOC106066468 n=1 Tax=Biomphalaria glabrata TaxID=6526 RepID=A0A9W3ARF2_BIOGL|nr:uncharacterized protein LOC106066468 [Biomphalaria glabrata]
MNVESHTPERKIDTKNKIAVLIWLCLVSGLGAMKIIVGSININSGCLGLSLLPYYFLIGGVLALVPACLTLLVSCCRQSENLSDMWGLMAKVLAFWLLLLITGTLYIVTNAVKVTSVDRLCSHSWFVILAFCVLAADWLTVVFFYRLFCKLETLPEARPETPQPCAEDSPFYLWKMRQRIVV